MNGHRSDVRNAKTTYIYEHFNMEGHNFHEAKIQIIDYIDLNGVSDITKARKDL